MNQQTKALHRVTQLVADGYLLRGSTPNTIILTPKGLAVLMAFAERPLEKADLKKPSLPVERARKSDKAD